jgi:hypothetical protein
MADRIFPTHVNEDPLDSEMVFQGIDWDNFNNRLAEVKEAGKTKGKLNPGLQAYLDKKNANASEDCKKCNCDPCECDEEDKPKSKKDKCPECDCDPCECDDEKDVKKDVKNTKKDASVQDIINSLPEAERKKLTLRKKASYVFNHPLQLSADAVEAAIAAGDVDLKNAILAARHERRVRLASKVETIIKAEAVKNQKLAQRKTYRESLVTKVANDEKAAQKVKTANTNTQSGFRPITNLPVNAKKAFASKALAQGFPQEYVDAMLGNNAPVTDNTVDIKNVMASNLATSVKKTAVASMVKEATLSDADYSRLIDYWKNDLGYGDQDWIEALFTKKYDKKS